MASSFVVAWRSVITASAATISVSFIAIPQSIRQPEMWIAAEMWSVTIRADVSRPFAMESPSGFAP
jgi:hypothetical protein